MRSTLLSLSYDLRRYYVARFFSVGVGPRNAGALAKFLADILGDYSANTANFKFSALSSLLRFLECLNGE